MKLNKKWGYGQLFGFSALEGPNRYYEDTILMLMKKRLNFRYEFRPHYISFNFPYKGKISFKAIMSDFVIAKINDLDFKLTFLDNDTLVGVSPCLPIFKGEKKLHLYNDRGVDIYNIDTHYLGLKYVLNKDNTYTFVIHHSFSLTEARSGANFYIKDLDVDYYLNKKINYYKKIEKPIDKKYESLYYKCLSINRVNLHSPEGKITSMWSTPDRVPHRHMWMWDSAFHSMAIVHYNPHLAKEIFLAMLKQTRSDGFMPHMANPTDSSDVTQPCIMSYATYYIYQVTKDKEFLKQCLPYLENYLTYDLNNRDKNNNGLLEWFTEPNYKECKCGESGLDNSPRFDFDEEMDCIDFSTYFALDSEHLSKIYEELGDHMLAKKWLDISNKTKQLIQKLLWDEETGMYYDRLFSGKITKVLTHSSLLPMLANIPNHQQAERMVKMLFDKNKMFTNFPVSSISKEDPRFGNDMWRGGVWLNLNYFIIKGLKQYGYIKEADEIRNRTLEVVNKWYKKTGCVFEFYDPNDEISPFFCHRKGNPTKVPDYRKHVHSISDYNWSACFTLLLIQGRY